jgi:hypothetical protein
VSRSERGIVAEIDEQIKQLRSTHELWDKYSPRWDFYLSAYEGGEEFAKPSNISIHPRENEDDYNERVKRLHNMNYCELLVSFFTNFIFNESIERSGGTNQDFFDTFTKDVNRKGEKIDSFMRQVSDDMQIFGMSYVLVDAPQVSEGIVTKGQEDEQGIRPYWVLVKPLEILDWVTDHFDKFLYVKRVQCMDAMVGGERKKLEVYTEFYEDEVVISRVDVTKSMNPELLDVVTMPNTLGEVPLRVARYKRGKIDPFVGISFLRDFAGNNREILNLTSLLQEFLYRQAFNILAKESDGLDDENSPELDIGANNLLTHPKGTKAPSYISPPVDPAQFIQAERSRIKAEMLAIASQDIVSEMANGEKSSGFSQAQSFYKTVPFISTRADTLEELENSLMVLTMKRISKTWDGKIRYKDRYELTNLTDALTQLQILIRDFQMPSETFVKEALKRAVFEYDSKLPDDKKAMISKEVEGFNFKQWMETQKEALVGKSLSPGDQQKPKQKGTAAESAATANNQPDSATNKVRKPGQQAA